MTNSASSPPAKESVQEQPAGSQAAYATDAIPSGIEKAQFLSDPVTDQLVRVVMELGAALWVERRRSRTLERVLTDAGVLAADALEQWVEDPADTEADRRVLDQWMKRIYGPLTHIRSPTETPEGEP